MAGTRYSAPIDFNSYDAVRFRVERRATDPATADKFVGRMWLNTTSHALKVQSDTSTTVSLASGSNGSKYAANVGAGSTTVTITHNLNTLDVVAKLYLISTGVEIVPTSVTLTSVNVVTMVVSPSLGSNLGRAVVFA